MTSWVGRVTDAASRRSSDSTWPTGVPRNGLLCTLVLAPSALPRNRFFRLFKDAEAKKARTRAARLRATVRHLLGRARGSVELVDVGPTPSGAVQIRYRIPAIKLDRSLWLDPLELSLFRLAIDRIASALPNDDPQRAVRLGVLSDERLALTQEDRERVDEALAQFWRVLAAPDPCGGSSSTSRDPGGD